MAKIKISSKTEDEITKYIELLSTGAQVELKGKIGKSKDNKYFNVHLDVRQIQRTN